MPRLRSVLLIIRDAQCSDVSSIRCCRMQYDQAGWGSGSCIVLLLCCRSACSYPQAKGLTSQDAVCMSSEGAGVSDLSSRHGSQEHGLPSHNRLLASGLRAYTQHTSASPPKYTRYTTCVCDEVYLFHLAGLTFVQSRKVKSRDVLRLRCSKHGHRLKFRDANSVLTQECGNSTL